MTRLAVLLLPLLALLSASGCAVPQPRGNGELSHRVEPTTRRGYWLYLPESYVNADDAERRARPWPLVVTFHGMKPFDSAHPQALEWEQEADRYGFVVLAPELAAPDVLQQFPVRTVHPAFKSDEIAVLAIVRQVFAETDADPNNVLATSWSSGGYLAHYMLNQHPEVFTCLAVRQSNFSSSILSEDMTARSRYHPVLVVMTQNDFAGCKAESKEAVRWYDAHGYANADWVEIKGLGHERTPDMAAEFLGRVAEVRPLRPPSALVKRQAINGSSEGLAFFSGNMREIQRPPATARREPRMPALPETPPRASTVSSGSTVTSLYSDGSQVARMPAPAETATPQPPAYLVRPATPERSAALRTAPSDVPVSIRASSAIGIEPLYLNFSAECPAEWQRSAEFLWTIDGNPICKGVNGQKTLATPGEHTLGLLVQAPNGREYRASRRIRVLPRLDASNLTSANSR